MSIYRGQQKAMSNKTEWVRTFLVFKVLCRKHRNAQTFQPRILTTRSTPNQLFAIHSHTY